MAKISATDVTRSWPAGFFYKLLDYFVFSSLYISFCAIVMVDQACLLLIHRHASLPTLGFVFFSTMCSYNFHWYLTPDSITDSHRVNWAQHHRSGHLIFYIMGLLGSLLFFIPLRAHWLDIAAVAFLTFLYSAPKIPHPLFSWLQRIAIGKTLFLALVWTGVTTTLPVLLENESLTPAGWLLTLSRFGLIYAICILFDYRDREDDRQQGVRSMVTLFTDKNIDRLFVISLVLFALANVLLLQYSFSVKTILILFVPGLVVAGLYNYSKKNLSDYYYYIVLDGLMMLSSLGTLILGI